MLFCAITSCSLILTTPSLGRAWRSGAMTADPHVRVPGMSFTYMEQMNGPLEVNGKQTLSKSMKVTIQCSSDCVQHDGSVITPSTTQQEWPQLPLMHGSASMHHAYWCLYSLNMTYSCITSSKMPGTQHTWRLCIYYKLNASGGITYC